MKIVVTGSLGNVGKPLATDLANQGHDVIVISSKEEKRKDIEQIGAKAAIGSIEDVNFLESAFEGANAIFALIPPNMLEADPRAYYKRIANNYANAVRKTGVKRLVQLSSVGADLDSGTGFILGSHDAEEIFNSLDGVSVTNLRPGYFYVNLFGLADMVKHMGFIATNYGGDTKFPMVDPADIATVAAEELSKSGGEKVVYISGEDITANEAAKKLGEAIGKPNLEWKKIDNEQMTAGLSQSGMPDVVIKNFVEMGHAIATGALREDYDKHQPIIGKVKLKDFAPKFAAAVNG
ncbi:NAD(P)H-binding protein [Mucilaginibacter ginkgonis]|uniref:NAD(P)H-binding protein n=1 Tax=Mucilaginibacter ginkgonis TaxID=2682091 RepID=A0A6I4INW8_9SPHI|nr:NAD(P)H-binding protein [Mucilaginibacter ginkgonis]QQL48964.1 NAD(P)H-binding protein [Mucilaginibacter ginkgonis]